MPTGEHTNNLTNCNTTTGNPSLTPATNRVRGAARLDLVKHGLSAGKSKRKIADELGYDEKTVRRDIEKLSLPPDQLAAIQNGDTAEKYLNQARLKRTGKDQSAAARHRKRLATDKGSGIYSDAHASTVDDWLDAKGLSTPDREIVLKTLKRPEYARPDHNRTARADLAQLLATLERQKSAKRVADNLNDCADVLNSALFHVEPIKAIRFTAIDKALKKIREAERWPPYPDGWKAEYENIKRRRDPKK